MVPLLYCTNPGFSTAGHFQRQLVNSTTVADSCSAALATTLGMASYDQPCGATAATCLCFAARQYSNADMEYLAAEAQQSCEQRKPVPDHNPFRGESPLLQKLPYLELETVAVIPFMHAFFQGVVKDFLKALFRTMGRPKGLRGGGLGNRPVGSTGTQSKKRRVSEDRGQQGPSAAVPAGAAPQHAQPAAVPAAGPSDVDQQQDEEAADVIPDDKVVPQNKRPIVSQRAKGFAAHPSKNRPVLDPVKNVGSMHLDELAECLTLYAPLFWPVCDGNGQVLSHVVPDEYVREAWGLLRDVGLFNMQTHQFNTQQEFEAAVQEMQDKLIAYGKLAEQVGVARGMLLTLCTFAWQGPALARQHSCHNCLRHSHMFPLVGCQLLKAAKRPVCDVPL